MPQFEEEFQRRVEEMKRAAHEASQDLRKFASDVQEQMQYLANDVRQERAVHSPFEQTSIEKIRALAELRDEGIITEEEFQEKKAKLLEQI